MSGDVLTDMTDQVSGLLQERLRVKGRSLDAQAAKLGRRLPKRVRRDLTVLLDAQKMQGHPKLAQLIDEDEIKRAGNVIVAHLKTVDPREVAKDKVLWALAKVSAFGIAVVIGLIWYAWSRGLI